MRKRDRARQWEVIADNPFDRSMGGDNRYVFDRLVRVSIGEWLKVKLIEPVKGKEKYAVQFGDQTYTVSINDRGEPVIRLLWAQTMADAKPMNVGQLKR